MYYVIHLYISIHTLIYFLVFYFWIYSAKNVYIIQKHISEAWNILFFVLLYKSWIIVTVELQFNIFLSSPFHLIPNPQPRKDIFNINNYISPSIHIIRIPLATALTTHKSPKSIIRITLFSSTIWCISVQIFLLLHPYNTQNTIFILCSDLPDFLSCVLVLSLFYICNWKSHPCLLIHFQPISF